ncbi:MAG: methyltransferase domain-containing protein [Ignavibacteriaceae bacterium]|jgi:ubiquinone/menaquinone biosynthesis C-methylase UbiE|nr:methyltransferase domain-containing protein [Ignavibacteriaceae bacterium]
MAEFKLDRTPLKDGIYILSEINNEFEKIYLKLREKENRIFSDDEVKKLPFASDSNPHKKEWDLRVKSFQRFKEYLKSKKQNLNIIDLGCGNGWFSGQLSKTFNHIFFCVDVNLPELKQGRKVFNSAQIKFAYADIFKAEIPFASVDIIIINAAVQYFPDTKKLMEKLLTLINEDGEIHIIDSPFYSESEVGNASNRTTDYYRSIGFPEMTKNYFHHAFSELSEFNYEVLYNPKSFNKKVLRLLSLKDSPFPWIKITR